LLELFGRRLRSELGEEVREEGGEKRLVC